MVHPCPGSPAAFFRLVQRRPVVAILAAAHHHTQAEQFEAVLPHIEDPTVARHFLALVRFHRERERLALDFLGGLSCARSTEMH